MKIKLSTLVVFLVALISSPTFAFTSISEDLGTSATATDIALFRCSARAGIIMTRAKIRDNTPINATPSMRVQIASATSPTTCPASDSGALTGLVP